MEMSSVFATNLSGMGSPNQLCVLATKSLILLSKGRVLSHAMLWCGNHTENVHRGQSEVTVPFIHSVKSEVCRRWGWRDVSHASSRQCHKLLPPPLFSVAKQEAKQASCFASPPTNLINSSSRPNSSSCFESFLFPECARSFKLWIFMNATSLHMITQKFI